MHYIICCIKGDTIVTQHLLFGEFDLFCRIATSFTDFILPHAFKYLTQVYSTAKLRKKGALSY